MNDEINIDQSVQREFRSVDMGKNAIEPIQQTEHALNIKQGCALHETFHVHAQHRSEDVVVCAWGADDVYYDRCASPVGRFQMTWFASGAS